MRFLALGATMVLLASAPAAYAQTASPLTLPEAVKSPSTEQIAAAYPAQALAGREQGQAWIGCVITVQGVLADCEVVDERPAGRPLGFGEAALTLAPLFLFKPAMRGGQAIQTRVNLPVSFELPAPVNRRVSP